MDHYDYKRSQLEKVARYRDDLRSSPRLKWLFFEITDRCNLRCRHCGSSCTDQGRLLTVRDVANTLETVDPKETMVCLTGGEPLMHPSFFEIARCVHESGFAWGMTTNATLIDNDVAFRLKEVGMDTVSVSIDGFEQSHDELRQRPGSWAMAVRGLRSLQNAGFDPQVTTVFHQHNFHELESLYTKLCEWKITSWRPINVEPIGRASESGDLLLKPQQFAQLLSFIREKRLDPECPMRVSFGCSHYLGTELEHTVRDHYFLCGAGVFVASVRSNGDICACLDIANRPDLVQGNIRTDRLMDVWQNRFKAFRRDRTSDCSKCLNCSERVICGGDSAHTWDYDKNEPLLCCRDFCQALK